MVAPRSTDALLARLPDLPSWVVFRNFAGYIGQWGASWLVMQAQYGVWQASLKWDETKAEWGTYAAIRAQGAVRDAVRKETGRGAALTRRYWGPVPEMPAPALDADRSVYADEVAADLAMLTDDERFILTHCPETGWSNAEVGEMLGVGEYAVMSRRRYVRRRLRRLVHARDEIPRLVARGGE